MTSARTGWPRIAAKEVPGSAPSSRSSRSQSPSSKTRNTPSRSLTTTSTSPRSTSVRAARTESDPARGSWASLSERRSSTIPLACPPPPFAVSPPTVRSVVSRTAHHLRYRLHDIAQPSIREQRGGVGHHGLTLTALDRGGVRAHEAVQGQCHDWSECSHRHNSHQLLGDPVRSRSHLRDRKGTRLNSSHVAPSY